MRPATLCSRLGIGLVLAATLSGCLVGDPDPEVRAAEIADAYLRAVTDDQDHGWQYLSTNAQEAWHDRAAYEAVASAADWSSFDATVTEALICHDDTTCSVCLRVEATAVPDFLKASDRQEDGIAFHDSDLACGNATLGVYVASALGTGSGVTVGP